jgi:tetratricopeptide (TPR) repeat protein
VALIAMGLFAISTVKHHDSDDWETLARKNLEKGQSDMAASGLRIAREALTKVLGKDDLEIVRINQQLLKIHLSNYHFAEAIPIAEAISQRMSRVFGEGGIESIHSLRDLAEIYKKAGRIEEAIKLNRIVIELLTAKFGSSDIETLSANFNLSQSYWEAGKKNEAIDMLTIVAHQSRQLFEASDLTTDSLTTLSRWEHEVGRCDKALDALLQLEPVLVRQVGANHLSTEKVRTVIKRLIAAPKSGSGCLNAYN